MARRVYLQNLRLLIAALFVCCLSAYAAPQRNGSAERGLSLKADCGVLSVTPIAEGAMRVRCAPTLSEDSHPLVLIHGSKSVPSSVRKPAASASISTSRLTATYDRKTGVLRFTDPKGRMLLEELPGARRVQQSSVQGQPTLTAEDRFRSPADEHIFGSGQFQDGFLDIRDLPRRLTQVNSQISIPFLISSKGYGLLWHNYGLTDLNPADNRLTLVRDAVGNSTTAAVTTSEGARTVRRTTGVFTGEFEATAPGRHAMLLDVGQEMAQRYHVEIDGKTVVDFANRWLPPIAEKSFRTTGSRCVSFVLASASPDSEQVGDSAGESMR